MNKLKIFLLLAAFVFVSFRYGTEARHVIGELNQTILRNYVSMKMRIEEQISELERKKEEYTNLINLFKLILLFEKPKDGEEKEADKLIEKIYNTYIKKEGE